MTECFELIDRKLLKGPWVMGEQYAICDPRMAAGYSADEKAKLLSARRTQNHGQHAAKGIEQLGGAPGLVSGGRVVRERDREFESISLQQRVGRNRRASLARADRLRLAGRRH
jgi:hypothetical protein